MIGPVGRLAVRLAYEVVQEWRRLGTSESEPGHQEMSCTSADTERAPSWDHDKRRPAVAAQASQFGFSKGAP